MIEVGRDQGREQALFYDKHIRAFISLISPNWIEIRIWFSGSRKTSVEGTLNLWIEFTRWANV